MFSMIRDGWSDLRSYLFSGSVEHVTIFANGSYERALDLAQGLRGTETTVSVKHGYDVEAIEGEDVLIDNPDNLIILVMEMSGGLLGKSHVDVQIWEDSHEQ